jgi:hypothetical protein
MIKTLDQVVLTEDLVEYNLRTGDIGTVVLTHQQQGYEVEFVTLTGDTVAVVSLAADQLRAIGHREIAHARAIV